MASLDRGFVMIDHVIVDLSENIVLGAFQEAAHIGMRLKIFILVLVGHSNVSICEHRLLTRCGAAYAVCMEETRCGVASISRSVFLIDRIVPSPLEQRFEIVLWVLIGLKAIV